jgi:lipopolysaccharide biosynthesis glycosyltransferase
VRSLELRRIIGERVLPLADRVTADIHLYPALGVAARASAATFEWLAAGRHPGRRSLLRLGIVRSGVPLVLAALVGVRDVTMAERVLELGEETWPGRDDQRWQLRRLQVLCAAGRYERAESVVAGWGGMVQLPQGTTATVAALWSNLGRYDDVIELLTYRARQGQSVPTPLFWEAIVASVRRTGRYDEVIALLATARPGRFAVPLRRGLEVEAELRAALDPGRDRRLRRPFDERIAAYDRALTGNRRAKSPTGSPSLVGPSCSTRQINGTVLWCTDASFLLGTCVSMFSLLRHNPDVEPVGGLQVVVDPAALALAADVFGELSRVARRTIAVTDAAALVPSGQKLRSEYGLFTPGDRLSSAAYYRLFALRQLAEERPEGRVVYLDSDTCVGPGFSGVFDVDLQHRPLAARAERPRGLRFESRRSAIEQAAHNLGLDAASYVNSGVLVCDAAHPELVRGLDRAIDAALHKASMLMLHDQCALNFAFADNVAPLPEAFNCLVRPQTAVVAAPAVVTHFIEQPKPWDVLYSPRNARGWLDEFSALASALAPGRMAELLRGAFDMVSDSRTGASPGAADG